MNGCTYIIIYLCTRIIVYIASYELLKLKSILAHTTCMCITKVYFEDLFSVLNIVMLCNVIYLCYVIVRYVMLC